MALCENGQGFWIHMIAVPMGTENKIQVIQLPGGERTWHHPLVRWFSAFVFPRQII
jgi:hypothetical protein